MLKQIKQPRNQDNLIHNLIKYKEEDKSKIKDLFRGMKAITQYQK